MNYPASVLTLAIEATNPNVPTPGVLLAEGERIRARGDLERGGRHDDLLLPLVGRLLHDQGVGPAQLEQIVVSIGPGGFTASRLACVAAAMLGELSGAQLLTVPTAWVAFASTLGPEGLGRPAVVAMATKGEQAFVCRSEPGSATRDEGRSVSAEAFAGLAAVGEVLIHEGHLPPAFEAFAQEKGLQRAPMRLTPEGLLACLPLAEEVAPEALRPIYPREPDAVTQWRRRHGRAPGDA